MPLKISIEKDILFESPHHHITWSVNVSYAEPKGERMIMTAHITDTRGAGVENWTTWRTSVQRRVSEDNGATWRLVGECHENGSLENGNEIHGDWQHFLDQDRQTIISVHNHSLRHPEVRGKVWEHRENRFYYQLSRDGGSSWTSSSQIIHPAPRYDTDHWMPEIIAGKRNACADQAPFVKLSDGTIIMGIHILTGEERNSVVAAFLKAKWEVNQLAWDISEPISLASDDPHAHQGVCEPDLVVLPDKRLVSTLRCRGRKDLNLFSCRKLSLSEDGGRSWSPPRTLTYDDGSPVHVPASLARFLTDPETGRIFWFGNILAHPVNGCDPRYPLTMAEFDPDSLSIIKDSVTIIQDLPSGALKTEDGPNGHGRRYSNFGHYIDRKDGAFVLFVPQSPNTSWEDGTADCLRYRIHRY